MKTHIANDKKINIKTNANNLQHPTHLESFKKTKKKKNTHNRTAKKLPIKQNHKQNKNNIREERPGRKQS